MLEDEALDLMERREVADAALAEVDREHSALLAEVTAAESRRDDSFADLDDELGRHRAAREELVGGLPGDLAALYEKIRATGRDS